MFKRVTVAVAFAVFAMTAAGAAARQADKPQEKPKETTVVIKDDATPKIKQGAKVVSDATINSAVKTRLMGDKVARGTSIDVDTKDGAVTIAGAVPTEADKIRIGSLVARTTGVKSVDNNLTVSPAAAGTTGKGDTKVVIKDDATPKVKAAAKKTTDAVKDTKIVVKDDTTPQVKKGARVVADAEITAAVKTKLLGDTAVSGRAIDVDTEKGVVTLTGTVSSEAEKAEAIRLAKTTAGVNSVVDKLTVK